MTIEEISKEMKISFPEEYPQEKSLSWLILEILHRFPKQGEKIEITGAGVELTVVDMDEEYIDKVRIVIR